MLDIHARAHREIYGDEPDDIAAEQRMEGEVFRSDETDEPLAAPVGSTMRFARILNVCGKITVEEVQNYLPANYTAELREVGQNEILVYGVDDAGWTLDGYVIPRLSTGNIYAEEVN